MSDNSTQNRMYLVVVSYQSTNPSDNESSDVENGLRTCFMQAESPEKAEHAAATSLMKDLYVPGSPCGVFVQGATATELFRETLSELAEMARPAEDLEDQPTTDD